MPTGGGRCAVRLQFTPFSDIDAAALLTEHGVTPGGSASTTLAELFARAKGHELEREKPVGFGS
jgi:hypothetical protein